VNDLWTRAGRVWRVMRSDPATAAGADGVTLVVAHNAINQALLCTALGVGAEAGFRAVTWPNGGAIELDWMDGADRAVWRWIWPEPEHSGWLSTLPADSERQDVFG